MGNKRTNPHKTMMGPLCFQQRKNFPPKKTRENQDYILKLAHGE